MVRSIAFRTVLGEEHPHTAGSYSNLAVCLMHLGKFTEAESLLRRTLEVRHKQLGEEHPATAAVYNNLAGALDGQGKHADVEPLFRKALKIRLRTLGALHADTATSYNNIASALFAQGRFADADPLLLKALEINRQVLGEEHPATVNCYDNFAVNLREQGKLTEAESHARRALDIRRTVLGDAHPATAFSYNNVATNLDGLGRFREAEPLYRNALEIRRNVLGDVHFQTARSYNNLALNLEAQGRAIEAEALHGKDLEISRIVLGEMHPDLATSYNNLASNLGGQGKFAQAEPLLRKALEIRRQVLGEENPDTADSYGNFAGNLASRGRSAEAEPLFGRSLQIKRQILGDEHPRTAESYSNVGANLDDQRKFAQGEAFARKALEIRRKVLGDEHVETANSINNVASNLSARQNYHEAEALFSEALAISLKVLGEDHPRTATHYHNLASNFIAQGKFLEAERNWRKALEIRRRILGEEHPQTATSYHSLASCLFAQARSDEAVSMLSRGIFSYEASRQFAAVGIERALLADTSPRLLLAVLENLSGQPDAAWHNLEATLARAMLDEQARRRSGLMPAQESEQGDFRLRLASAQAEILFLVSLQDRTTDQEDRLATLLDQRQAASEGLAALTIASSTREIAGGEAIRAALPEDAALLLWADVTGIPNIDEHWACLVRRQGAALWERLPGSGEGGAWTQLDTELPARLRTALRGSNSTPQELESLIDKLRAQRVSPVEKHLAGVRTLYVAPVWELVGLPLELIAAEFQIEYVPSGTALVQAGERVHFSGENMLLAVGDPAFPPVAPTLEPPLPPGGILVLNVVPGGAAENKIVGGDVLLSYGDIELTDVESLGQALAATAHVPAIPVKVWRLTKDGKGTTTTMNLTPGRLGVNLAQQPARELLAARYQGDVLLAPSTRSGRIDPVAGEKQPWQELPGTAVELDRLRTAFGGQAIVLSRSAASEQELEALRAVDQLRNFRYLHFATHGLANDQQAFESFIALSQDNLPPYDARPGERHFNGELSAQEVKDGWTLEAELVTLSACGSGLGTYGGGDGLLGFAQAFLLAGARRVCLSLWDVDDTATYLLMDRFYANMLGRREGLTAPLKPSAALREAKSWLRELTAAEILKHSADMTGSVTRGKGERLLQKLEAATIAPHGDLTIKPYADPRFWSAFVLIGEPD